MRSLLALLAYKINVDYLPYLGIFTFCVGVGFLYNYLFGTRETGRESSAKNNIIWWNDFRPLHAFLYLLFTYYAFNKREFAYKILVVDVIFAIIIYTLYKTNNL